MTTDYLNISKSGTQQFGLRQLPPVSSEKQQLSESPKTDNIVRMEAVERQTIAKLEQEKTVEKQTLTSNSGSEGRIDQSINELNASSQLVSRNLEFRIDKDSGRTVITVRDSTSNEIIRQIPSDQLLQISSRLKELQDSNLETSQAAGILFTSKT